MNTRPLTDILNAVDAAEAQEALSERNREAAYEAVRDALIFGQGAVVIGYGADEMIEAKHVAQFLGQPLAASEETQEKGSMNTTDKTFAYEGNAFDYEGVQMAYAERPRAPRMVGAERSNTVASDAGTLTAAVARLEMVLHAIVGAGHRAHDIANVLGGPVPEDEKQGGPVGVPPALNAHIHALLDRIEREIDRVSSGHHRCEALVGRSRSEDGAAESLRA